MKGRELSFKTLAPPLFPPLRNLSLYEPRLTSVPSRKATMECWIRRMDGARGRYGPRSLPGTLMGPRIFRGRAMGRIRCPVGRRKLGGLNRPGYGCRKDKEP